MIQNKIYALRQDENGLLVNETGFSGSGSFRFRVATGARLVVDLIVHSTSGTVNVDLSDAANGEDFLQILNLNTGTTGVKRKVISDFHQEFKVDYDVSGGTADFEVHVTVRGNAASTFVENANLEVDVDHTEGDSVQVGDGTDVMEVNPDGSINVNVTGLDLDAADEFTTLQVTPPAANTEFSVALPSKTTHYTIAVQDVGGAKLRLAPSVGGTNTSYKTIKVGNEYESPPVSFTTGKTIYLQSNKAGITIEVVAYFVT